MFSRHGNRARSQPSHYSPLPFHIIRTFSILSSLVVSAIMIYFMYHLSHDNYKIPWTFILLMAVSLLSLITITATTVLHCCTSLSPRLNLFINVPLFVLWAVSFSLLAWNMSGTLTHVCNNRNWGNSDGVMICRLYKTLFSFAVLGVVASIATVALDIRTRRKQSRFGNYAAMGRNVYGRDISGGRASRMSEKSLVGHGPESHRHQSLPEINVEPFRERDVTDRYTDSAPPDRADPRQNAAYDSYDSPAPNGEYGRQAWGQGNMKAEDFEYSAGGEHMRYDGPTSYGGR